MLLIVGYAFSNNEGSRCFYVLPFYLLMLFPLFYAGMGLVKLYGLKTPFTLIAKDESIDRMQTSAGAMTILSAAHTVGEMILMLTGGVSSNLIREIICTVAIALAGVSAYGLLILTKQLVSYEEKAEPEENDAEIIS